MTQLVALVHQDTIFLTQAHLHAAPAQSSAFTVILVATLRYVTPVRLATQVLTVLPVLLATTLTAETVFLALK